MLRFHRAMIYLTFVFFYKYACGRYVLNGRVTFSRLAYLVSPFPISRATGSCTRMFPFRFTCSPLLVRIWIVDSSPATCLFHVSPFVSSTRTLTFLAYAFPLLSRQLVFMLTVTAYAYLLQLVDSSTDSLFLNYDSYFLL